jgi:hypothetical protein
MRKKKYVVLDRASAKPISGTQPVDASAAEAGLVLITGPDAGGPDQLTGELVDVLIACEQRGTATVLLAGTAGDLDTPVAAVSRYIATDQADVAKEAQRRFGAERVHMVSSVHVGEARSWVGDLRAAIGRPAASRNRSGKLADRIMPIRELYGKIRRRNTRPRGAGSGASTRPTEDRPSHPTRAASM